MNFSYEIIPIDFVDGTPIERDTGTEKFILGLLVRKDDGRLVIPMEGLTVFSEIAKNTGDHTPCNEALFAYAQFGGMGRFIYLDNGGGPKKPWDWCLQDGNSTGNPVHNYGLGMSTILETMSKPIGMEIKVIRSGSIFGYSGTWPSDTAAWVAEQKAKEQQCARQSFRS